MDLLPNELTSRCDVNGGTSLNGLYTDFDNWIINFNKNTTHRSTYFSTEIKTTEQNKNTDNKKEATVNIVDLRLQHLFVHGVVNLRKKCGDCTPRKIFIKFHDSEEFVNYDYILSKLLKEKGKNIFLDQYNIRSKL